MTTSKPTRPQEFWRDHVLPNYEEYRKHPDSIRHAMNATLSAFHMADWVLTSYYDTDPQKVAGTQTVADYCRHLANNGCPDILVLKDIAEAHKHLKLHPTAYGRVLTSAGATGLGSFGAITRLGLTGTPMAAPERLVVQQQDGSKRAFDEVIENVIQMWEELIGRVGL